MRRAAHPSLRPSPRRGKGVLACAAFALALAGCKLVDQTTFARAPVAPSAAQLTAEALPPIAPQPALLTVRYSTPQPDYAGALATAVAAAEQRRPGGDYDVVAVIPVEKDPAVEARRLREARFDAAEVMRRMILLGVPEQRIRLGARTDPAATVREVRVYVR